MTSTCQLSLPVVDAASYKASLPKGRGGTAWSIETFSVYVNLLYPHITVVSGQEWKGASVKYQFMCEKHGLYEARAMHVLKSALGCQCKGCHFEKNTNCAGTIRRRRASQEEKDLAAKLHADGLSYRAIARQLGRGASTIVTWLVPEYAESQRQCSAEWREHNRERTRACARRYTSDFEHGKAGARARSAHRRLLRTNAPESVFLDGQWHEVDRDYTYKVFNQVLLPPSERKAIQELYLEAQYLTETTGIVHHVDHIQPLSKGGEHCMLNLQILTAEENLSKGDTFRKEDQEELARRLFFQTTSSTFENADR